MGEERQETFVEEKTTTETETKVEETEERNMVEGDPDETKEEDGA